MAKENYKEIMKKEAEGDFTSISAFAKYLNKKYPYKSTEAWRWVCRQYDQSTFEHFKEEDYSKHIPLEWEGKKEDLARFMNRRFPSISMSGWRGRISRAYERNAITTVEKPDFTVNHLKSVPQTGEDLWAAIEERSKSAIAGIEDARWADIEIKDSNRFIGIAFASDQHIGNPFCDHERLREDSEMVANHPDCYIIHAGDYIDNFIIDKPRPAMKSPIPPSIQWKLCEHYIDICTKSLLAIVAGNHDLWTAGMTDYDPLKKMANERGILYHAHELNLRVTFGKVKYHISVRHKRRGNSQIDPSRVVKKMWDDGEADFDIGVIGHHHVPIISPFTKHGLERWAIRPGAYKIVDTFGEMCGFPRERPTCPMVILNPETREIQAFSDLRHGLRTLNAINEDYR